MKYSLSLLTIILSFASCIPPGKFNETLVNANKLSNSLDLSKAEIADSVSAFKQRESAFKQQIKQLEDSLSVVVKACAESQMQAMVTASLSNKPNYLIYFDFDKYTLVDSSFKLLSEVIDFLQCNDDYSCVLQGYTDLEGSPDYNLKLSENRVVSARNYLLSYGISANRITGSFFGKAFISIETRDRDANWRNRRVEIFLVKK